MARLRDRRGRPASSWDGNLVFRVRTPTGSVIHKVYRDSHGPLSLVVRIREAYRDAMAEGWPRSRPGGAP